MEHVHEVPEKRKAQGAGGRGQGWLPGESDVCVSRNMRQRRAF